MRKGGGAEIPEGIKPRSPPHTFKQVLDLQRANPFYSFQEEGRSKGGSAKFYATIAL